MPLPDYQNTLSRLASVMESRVAANGGDPAQSYVATLLQRGPDAFLKKIGEEATEVVLAAKDVSHVLAQGAEAGVARSHLVAEVADLWFHCLVALTYYGLRPEQVLAELERRQGTSGIEEKALRKLLQREQDTSVLQGPT